MDEVERSFEPPLKLGRAEGWDLWVYADDRGDFDIRLRCPGTLVAGIGDHYVVIDSQAGGTSNWMEPESKRWAPLQMALWRSFLVYRESVNLTRSPYHLDSTLSHWQSCERYSQSYQGDAIVQICAASA